ncbi:MAG: hypothetical protein NVSMB42_17300 [Herpetosiphon sp.]
MTTLSIVRTGRAGGLIRQLERAWQINPPLTVMSISMVLTLAGTMVGVLIDQRIITGAPAWIKPAKFAVSLAIYGFTLVWLLSFVRGHARLIRGLSIGTAAIGMIEQAIIVVQALRGTTSHYNGTTALDGALFNIMGAGITILWVLTMVEVVLLLRQRSADPALMWALRLGLTLVVLGMAVGFIMVMQRSPAQRAALAAGKQIKTAGAHSVGVEDGGPGLPVVGWSTTGGDLRIAHFFGLHAIQVLPLWSWLFARLGRWIGVARRARVAMVVVAGLGYGGWMGLLTWQALRGQPIVQLDGVTLAAYGVLAGTTLVAGAGVLLWDRLRHAYGTATADQMAR